MTTKRNLLLLVGATAAAALTTIGITLLGTEPDELHRSPLASPMPGTRRVFTADLDTSVSTVGGNAGHFHVTGQWIVQATTTPGRVHVYFDGARIESRFATDAQRAAMDAAAKDLTTPIEIAVDERGLIREVRENPRAPAQARAMLKAIAAYGQFAQYGRGKAWTSRESDATGTYDATYTRIGTGQYERRKQTYATIDHTTAELAKDSKLEVSASNHRFAFAPDGHLESLAVDETLAASGQFVSGLSTRTTVALRYVRDEPARALDLAHPLELVAHDTPAGNTDFSPEADAHRLAGRGFGDIVGVLDDLPSAGERDENEQRAARMAFIALGACMRLDDQCVAEAMQQIRAESPHSRTLWDALAQAGTPAAQAALRELIDTPRFDLSERRTQMIGLSMVNSPTAETIAFLHERFADRDQGVQARYGVGSAVYHLKDRRPEDAEAAFRILVAELGNETEVAHKAALLIAIGNAGYPAALPVVTPYLRAPESVLRRAAARGLRLLTGDHVDKLLADLALDDDSEGVRLSAVEVLGTRAPTSAVVSTLVTVADEDGSDTVRRRAEQALNELSARHPAVAQALAARR
jgi:HEAT repeat protein